MTFALVIDIILLWISLFLVLIGYLLMKIIFFGRGMLIMYTKLTEQEVNELSRFRYTSILEQDRSVTQMNQLLIAENMQKFLEEVKINTKAPDLKVAASVFVKYYAVVAIIHLYALSSWNKRLQFSLDSLYLINKESEGYWLPEYYFKSLDVEEFTGENRDVWRNQAIQHLFQEIISPMLLMLAQETKVSKSILWENMAVYIDWLYEKVFANQENVIFEDYQYLVGQAPGELFGPYQKNPIQRYHSEPVYLAELKESVRIRKTCCFTYLLGEKRTYCQTCPLYCKQFNTGKKN